jgi:hypothetical protein
MVPTFDEEACGASMPFPEKVAWLTLFSAVAIYGAFIGATLATPPAEQTVLRVVVLFAIALTVQGVVIAIAKPLLALHDPEEAMAPLDERDRSVARAAFKAAYLTLMGAVVLLAMGVPFAREPWQLTLSAYLATIAADMVRMAAIIVSYRRHG